MNKQTFTKTVIALGILIVYLLSMITFASAIIVNADYATIYAGEEANIKINVENNENYDIEDVSITLVLSSINSAGQITSLPFTIVGSSEKDLDDLNEDDDDSVSFKIKAANDIKPGDYNIPYIVKYTSSDTGDDKKKEGSFGIHVSARTEIDYSIEVKGENTNSGIVGERGRISLEIINKGLGEIKSVQVEVTPRGYDVVSNEKVFVGTINGEDSEVVSFDVIFQSKNPILNAKITYKDFENQEQTENINLVVKNIYTKEEALELGIIKKSNTALYSGIVIAVVLIWSIWRKIKKARQNKKREALRNGGVKG